MTTTLEWFGFLGTVMVVSLLAGYAFGRRR